jgi:hypothetical protein
MATGIGILSSIPFTGTPFEAAFKIGLRGAPTSVENDIGYDSTKLDAALGRLEGANAVKLIVTVGGLTPALRAAQSGRTKPFISIAGSVSGLTASARFRGAVNLQMIEHNMHRLIHIIQFAGIRQDDVCLLVNGKSQLAQEEQAPANWPSTAKVKSIDVDENTANPGNVCAGAFGSLPAGTKAVVVSADPFFTKYADNIITGANNWINADNTRRVAYPLFDHGTRELKNALVYGPNLMDEYKRLGAKARHVSARLNDPWTIDAAQHFLEHP